MKFQRSQSCGRDVFAGLRAVNAQPLKKMERQHSNVAVPFPQWWQVQPKNVEPEEQVRAEGAGGNATIEFAVAGCNGASPVRGARPTVTDGPVAGGMTAPEPPDFPASAGERPAARTWVGLALALGGLAGLTLPGAQAPSFAAAAAMIGAGLSWGAYSLRGRQARDGRALAHRSRP